jgi:hypothetical protein
VLILRGPKHEQLVQWGQQRQRSCFAAWRASADEVKMVTYVVALNVQVERRANLPWAKWLRGWLRCAHLALKALATKNMGQWWPYGRMSDDLLAHTRRICP